MSLFLPKASGVSFGLCNKNERPTILPVPPLTLCPLTFSPAVTAPGIMPPHYSCSCFCFKEFVLGTSNFLPPVFLMAPSMTSFRFFFPERLPEPPHGKRQPLHTEPGAPDAFYPPLALRGVHIYCEHYSGRLCIIRLFLTYVSFFSC